MSKLSGRKLERLKRSYTFFVACEQSRISFTLDTLSQETGWKTGTISTYLQKKWGAFLRKENGKYLVDGLANAFNEEEYIRLMSQREGVSNDPKRPELPAPIEMSLR